MNLFFVNFCCIMYVCSHLFADSVTFYETDRLFRWLRSTCPQYNRYINKQYPDTDDRNIVAILHQSLKQGHVLAELVNNANTINYNQQVSDFSNQYWQQFVRQFENKDLFLPQLMETSLLLDIIYQFLLPYIPQNFQSRDQIVLIRTGTDELIVTERVFVSKLLKLTHYVAKISHQCGNQFDVLLKMLLQLADKHQQMLLTLECPELEKNQQTRVIDFFRSILMIEDIYKAWIRSRCEESSQLAPLLALQSKFPFSTDIDVTQTLSTYMLLPMQRICRYQLLLHTIAQESKDRRFTVLEQRMQRYVERMNACRRTADIHSKIKNWTSQTEFLLNQFCEEEANVEIKYENKATKRRKLLRYTSTFLLLKIVGDDLYIAGMMVYKDIIEVLVLDERTLMILFQFFDRQAKIIVTFQTNIAYDWYDKYVTDMH